MKRCASGWCALLMSAAVFVGALVLTFSSLPTRVATHFDGAGRADGYMEAQAHVISMAGLGLAAAVISVGLFFALRYFPVGLVNMPEKEYWMSPARKEQTYDRFFHAGLWLAALELLFVLGLHLLVIDANRKSPPQMSNLLWTLGGSFAVLLLVWMLWLFNGFRRPVGRR